MADEVDLAQAKVDAFLANSLRRVRVQPPPVNHTGLCKACECEIEPERLAVNPHALLCMDCAETVEDARKRKARTGR